MRVFGYTVIYEYRTFSARPELRAFNTIIAFFAFTRQSAIVRAGDECVCPYKPDVLLRPTAALPM